MITLETEGLDALQDRLDGLAGRIRAELRQKIRDLAEALVGSIRQGPLDGGVLQRRSGTLAGSVAAAIVETDSAIRAEIGASAPYAKFQERGFDGTEAVRAHLARIREAFGRPIPARSVAIRAHQRQVRYAPHPFLAPSLADAADDIRQDLAEAVSRGIA